MPRFNRSFDLSVEDVDLIEEALRARCRELCQTRRALSDENPAHMDAIRVIEHDQRNGEELLGRLHDHAPGRIRFFLGCGWGLHFCVSFDPLWSQSAQIGGTQFR